MTVKKGKKYRMAKGENRGRALTQLQRETIVQAYAITGNKAQVARDLHISYPSIIKVLREAESDRTLQEARRRALDDVAGRVHGKTVEILDSIGPQDIESGLIKTFDAETGELKAVKAYGPSLMQKVTSAAILTDKLKVIEDTKAALSEDSSKDPNAMPLPQDMQTALRMISERVKRLRIIDVQLADNNPELVSQLQDVAHRASLNDNIEEADYEELDFDNPGA